MLGAITKSTSTEHGQFYSPVYNMVASPSQAIPAKNKKLVPLVSGICGKQEAAPTGTDATDRHLPIINSMLCVHGTAVVGLSVCSYKLHGGVPPAQSKMYSVCNEPHANEEYFVQLVRLGHAHTLTLDTYIPASPETRHFCRNSSRQFEAGKIPVISPVTFWGGSSIVLQHWQGAADAGAITCRARPLFPTVNILLMARPCRLDGC